MVCNEIIDKIFSILAQDVYGRDKCNSGHDFTHIQRMLAMRRTFWGDIIKEVSDVSEFTLDLAILFHDLDRSRCFRGRDEKTVGLRKDFMKRIMKKFPISEHLISFVVEGVEASHAKDKDDDSALIVLLRDLDKADMGAVGILRMQGVADERGYGYFRPKDFDFNNQPVKIDDNLGSVVEDVKFCCEWWDDPRFQIRTRAIRAKVEHRFVFMNKFIKQLEREMKEINLVR